MPIVSRKTVLLREAWRKAYREGEVRLEFPKSADAQRTRMMLYNAIQPYKIGQLDDDPELEQAAGMVEIRWLDEGKRVFALQSIRNSPAMTVLGAALGTSLDTVKSPAEAESEERAKEMLRDFEGLGKGLVDADGKPIPFGTTKNKFY